MSKLFSSRPFLTLAVSCTSLPPSLSVLHPDVALCGWQDVTVTNYCYHILLYFSLFVCVCVCACVRAWPTKRRSVALQVTIKCPSMQTNNKPSPSERNPISISALALFHPGDKLDSVCWLLNLAQLIACCGNEKLMRQIRPSLAVQPWRVYRPLAAWDTKGPISRRHWNALFRSQL